MIQLWRVLVICIVCSVFSLILSEGSIFSWVFQSPSYLLEKDTSGLGTYTCDTAKDTCKVNFNFTDSVPTDEPSTHYSCLIDFGFGITGEENKCNPNTVEFPEGEWSVHVIVKKIADDSIVNEGSIQIVHPDGTLNPLLTNFAREWQSPSHLLLKEDTTLTEYDCDPLETECKFNLQILPLYDGIESTKLTCEITSDFELVATSDPCNPNTSVVPDGDHILTIKIISKVDLVVLLTSEITLKNPPLDTSIDPTHVVITRTWQSPTYLLESRDNSKTEYSCDPEKSECKLNLEVVPLLDGAESNQLTCEINTDFVLVQTSDPCNPNTTVVPLGDHTLTIKILSKSDSSVLQTSGILIKNTPRDTSIDLARVTTVITWQQTTYLLDTEDTSKSSYTCDPTKDECKVNLLVTPKLDGAESSQLMCHITTDFGIEENDCNPNFFIVPSGSHILTIVVKNSETGDTIITRNITLVGQPLPAEELVAIVSSGGGGSSANSLDLTNVSIVVQSGLDSSGACKTVLCQVNFTSLVPDGATCVWNFGTGVFETDGTDKKCNPGYVKFVSDSIVTLTVTDPNNSGNTTTKKFQVYRTQLLNTVSTLLQARISLQTKVTTTKRLTDTGVSCALGKAKKCSLNFTAAESVGAKTWQWDFGNGEFSDHENPGFQSYEAGKYRVRLTVSDGVQSRMVTYDVEVVSELEKEIICQECTNMKGKIQISAALPNPPHADTVEWIEMRNIANESFSLQSCEIADESESFSLGGNLGSGKTLRLRQALTGLSLGNTHESLTLTCGGIEIDSFTWDFSVPSGYILRREVLQGNPEKTTVTNVVDGDTVDVMLDGKKVRLRLLGIDTPETVHPRKPVEKFGIEASNFTKKMLQGKEVWLTFDHEPVDHYGRRLAYVWQCRGFFSENSCTLFNEQIVSMGYGRMERRFEFRKYDEFDDLEKVAKKAKIGIWSDAEVAKEMNALGSAEEDSLQLEQEKEFLDLQEELLAECEEKDTTLCEEEKPTWMEVTKKMSTLNVSAKKSGIVIISGRTWGDLPLMIQVYQSEQLVHEIPSLSNETGEYEESWIPKQTGEYTVRIILTEQEASTVEMNEGNAKGLGTEPTSVVMEKPVSVEYISDHFASSLQASILLQGVITDNRWQEGNIFYCRSRGSCSVNVTAETNRSSDIEYIWILPDGSIFDGKNPPSMKLEYGQHSILLIASDNITSETIATKLQIDHKPIPKAPKKPKNTSSSSKYTLDLKEVPQDRGGGVALEGSNPLKNLGVSLVILVAVSLCALYFLKPLSGFGRQQWAQKNHDSQNENTQNEKDYGHINNNSI